jgi:electron transport complex protein RnfB
MAAMTVVSAEAIDALLPQTQCRKCGHDGCRPYAQALAGGRAEINRCPPGGARGIVRLAALLDRPALPLDPACGSERPLQTARIDESRCIGCTICIRACPVDAIAGAVRRMHTVFDALCTGCELCVAPCPMDCIEMIDVRPRRDWTAADAGAARTRMQARQTRLRREQHDNESRLAAKALRKLDELDARDDLPRDEIARRKAVVEAAIERARLRRAAPPPAPAR